MNRIINQIAPKIFEIQIPDNYERAMLFLRSQEYYESPFVEYKGVYFDVFEYMDFYRKWKGLDYFSYPCDWVGFNVPSWAVIESTYNAIFVNKHLATKYDYKMKEIINYIQGIVGVNSDFYLIGTDGNSENNIINHELAHGLFYVNEEYKKSCLDIYSKINEQVIKSMEDILLEMGYCKEVLIDEIQAYLSTGLTSKMCKIKGVKTASKAFISNFKNATKDLG